MTPLAHRIVRELARPANQRSTEHDRACLLGKMDDVHCFELSAVVQAASAIAGSFRKALSSGAHFAFLPAPKTWIEWKIYGPGMPGGRIGLLLERLGDVSAKVSLAGGQDIGWVSAFWGALPLRDGLTEGLKPLPDPAVQLEGMDGPTWATEGPPFFYACLALINTPRIIGRTTHMPHAGLQRELARANGMNGKFPLHAWTEIKLEVRPPQQQEGSQEIRLSGAKALHFCRAHLRVRLGKLELVSAHWRGDASLGIKRSRYRLVSGPQTEDLVNRPFAPWPTKTEARP